MVETGDLEDVVAAWWSCCANSGALAYECLG